MDQIDTERNFILQRANSLFVRAGLREIPPITTSTEQLRGSSELDRTAGGPRWDLFYLRTHTILSEFLERPAFPEEIGQPKAVRDSQGKPELFLDLNAILPAGNPKKMFGDLRVFEVLCAGAQDRPPKLPQAVSKATRARSGGTHLRPAMRANAPVQPAFSAEVFSDE